MTSVGAGPTTAAPVRRRRPPATPAPPQSAARRSGADRQPGTAPAARDRDGRLAGQVERVGERTPGEGRAVRPLRSGPDRTPCQPSSASRAGRSRRRSGPSSAARSSRTSRAFAASNSVRSAIISTACTKPGSILSRISARRGIRPVGRAGPEVLIGGPDRIGEAGRRLDDGRSRLLEALHGMPRRAPATSGVDLGVARGQGCRRSAGPHAALTGGQVVLVAGWQAVGVSRVGPAIACSSAAYHGPCGPSGRSGSPAR